MSPSRHPWVTAVTDHPAWSLLPDPGPTRDAVVSRVESWLAAVDQNAPSMAADPWRDSHVALRASHRLIEVMDGRWADLTASEVALVVAFPFAYQTYWTDAAMRFADVVPLNSPAQLTGDFDRFVSGYARLARRISDHADDTTVAAIRWWMYHRWLVRRPELYDTSTVAKVLGDDTTLSAADLTAMLNVVHRGPTGLLDTEATGSQTLRPQTALVLMAGQRLALDPTFLSSVVIDHVGIGDPVVPAQLLRTLRDGHWQRQGRSLVLNAVCSHHAVDVALHDQVSAVSAVFTTADHLGGPLVEPLPVQASADGVEAATWSDGVRAYSGHGFRFRLADDRVQELLMGEQLYGDRALAVRELYQNALDACRYRQARLDYLSRIGATSLTSSWNGEISFTSGSDSRGRPWLDCADNGVGMGTRELVDVFSNAGVRFADLPEFVQEQADWTREGIAFFPNSRFGIGVLSYFMLADEITVTTCRLDRSGHPGRLLRVSIAGPGALARIQDLGPGTDAGTTVRLHLRSADEPVSAVQTLRQLLWISPFTVTAEDATGESRWEPNVLADQAPVGVSAVDQEVATPAVIVGSDDPAVWWTDGTGAILADGLWVDTTITGAVVNLTGAFAPQLTVDRRSAVGYDEQVVSAVLQSQIPALLERGAQLFNGMWLRDLSRRYPTLADAIGEQAVALDHHWVIGHQRVPARAVGCFPADWDLFEVPGLANRSGTSFGDDITRWRLDTWLQAGLLPGFELDPDYVVPPRPLARPTDQILLSRDLDAASPWMEKKDKVTVAQVIRAAEKMNRPVSEIAERMRDLRMRMPVPAVEWPQTVTATDVRLLSRDVDSSSPWLANKVQDNSVYRAALALQQPPHEVAARLTELGIQVPQISWRQDVSQPDLVVMSRDRDGVAPWRSKKKPVPSDHVYGCAGKLQTSAAQVAARLLELGFNVPGEFSDTVLVADFAKFISQDLDSAAPWLTLEQAVAPGRAVIAAALLNKSVEDTVFAMREAGLDAVLPDMESDVDDALLLSRDLDRARPWLKINELVPIGHVFKAAHILGLAPAVAATRLTVLGFSVPDITWPQTTDENIITWLSVDLDGKPGWLASGTRVEVRHLISAARKTNRSPNEILATLLDLGFRAPRGHVPSKARKLDLRLLSRDLDSRAPWLKPGEKVSYGALVCAAVDSKQTVQQVARRARRLGLKAQLPLSGTPQELTSRDVDLVSRDLDGKHPWLTARTKIAPPHVIRAASRLRVSPAKAAAKFRQLGFEVIDHLWPDELERDDVKLVSRDFDGRAPWVENEYPLTRLVPAGQRELVQVLTQTARALTLGLTLPPGIRLHR